jgi:hypothetical protein
VFYSSRVAIGSIVKCSTGLGNITNDGSYLWKVPSDIMGQTNPVYSNIQSYIFVINAWTHDVVFRSDVLATRDARGEPDSHQFGNMYNNTLGIFDFPTGSGLIALDEFVRVSWESAAQFVSLSSFRSDDQSFSGKFAAVSHPYHGICHCKMNIMLIAALQICFTMSAETDSRRRIHTCIRRIPAIVI